MDSEASPGFFQTAETLSSPVEAFFLSPHSISHHLTHHLYPSVPFYNLRAARQLLEANPAFLSSPYFGRTETSSVSALWKLSDPVVFERTGWNFAPSPRQRFRGVLVVEAAPAGPTAIGIGAQETAQADSRN